MGVGKILCVNFLQNVAVTYGGMLLYHDYVYEPYNFAGINLRLVGLSTPHTCLTTHLPPLFSFSVVGSLLYSFIKYRESNWTESQVIDAQPNTEKSEKSKQTV